MRDGRVGARLALLLIVGTTLALAGCADTPILGASVAEHHATDPVVVDEGKAAAWVSAYRASHSLTPVTVDPALQRVAQAQASAMASANLLSHEVDGPLPRRLGHIGRERRAAVENVSAGYATMDAALGGWQRSPAHNANLLFAPMRRVGIAAAAAPGTRYKTFWALVMTD